ncbi:MAG: bacillithiol biosynthesis deacetylase BshB1 [Flavobacteriales bacterium]|nr:bacillithiol biosynthesis deacetylase BshB1 [Flavobacteriales bacterium]
MKKVDVLALGAHPDDIELSAGGTIAKMVSQGMTVAIADFTVGELGSRGNGPLRLKEAAHAAEILGVKYRENLELKDGFFEEDEESIRKIISAIREYQPEVVIANAIRDRHPDHGRGASISSRACFLSGLRRIETERNGVPQLHWRPKAVYHYIQDYHIEPDFVVDIKDTFDVKMESVKAYKSQFFDPESKEPSTPISGESFFDFLKARALHMGRPSGLDFAEGFTVERPPAVDHLLSLS